MIVDMHPLYEHVGAGSGPADNAESVRAVRSDAIEHTTVKQAAEQAGACCGPNSSDGGRLMRTPTAASTRR